MSDARIEHGIVGFVFWLIFVLARNPRCTGWEKVVMLPAALLGTWVPDWDLFLGIGFHRSPITHSALPVILMSLGVKSYPGYAVAIGFGLGVASHLFWDFKYYGNVHWIPGEFLDRVFLIVNAVGIVFWAWLKEPYKPTKHKKRLNHET